MDAVDWAWASGMVLVCICAEDAFERVMGNKAHIGVRFKDSADWIWLRDHKRLPEEEVMNQLALAYRNFRDGDTSVIEIELPKEYSPRAVTFGKKNAVPTTKLNAPQPGK